MQTDKVIDNEINNATIRLERWCISDGKFQF